MVSLISFGRANYCESWWCWYHTELISCAVAGALPVEQIVFMAVKASMLNWEQVCGLAKRHKRLPQATAATVTYGCFALTVVPMACGVHLACLHPFCLPHQAHHACLTSH